MTTSSAQGPVNFDKARDIAAAKVKTLSEQHDFQLIDKRTTERDFGWVFFYQTRKYIETGKIEDSVPGCGPVVVLKETGQLEFLPSSGPPARAIDDFEARWRQSRKPN